MPSFDVVSKAPWHEIENALHQAEKEITQRFDFKDTFTRIEKNKDGILVTSSSEERVKAGLLVFKEKLVKRKVSLKHIDPQKPEVTSKGGSKIVVKIKEGIEAEIAKKMVLVVKHSKLKVQASILGNELRVTGKNKDDLQSAIQLFRSQDLDVELQFVNFRD